MYYPSFLKQRTYDIVRDSTLGPSTRTGKNVSVPIINKEMPVHIIHKTAITKKFGGKGRS